MLTTLVSDGNASRDEQRLSEVDCANADAHADTSQVPRTPHARHGGDPQTTPILTTSYCQDPSSTDQESSVIRFGPQGGKT